MSELCLCNSVLVPKHGAQAVEYRGGLASDYPLHLLLLFRMFMAWTHMSFTHRTFLNPQSINKGRDWMRLLSALFFGSILSGPTTSGTMTVGRGDGLVNKGTCLHVTIVVLWGSSWTSTRTPWMRLTEVVIDTKPRGGLLFQHAGVAPLREGDDPQ